VAIYIKIFPGLKVRVSKRELRWSLGRERHACTSGLAVPDLYRGRMADVAQAPSARRSRKEAITMTREPSVVRWLDEILPLAMRPTPSGARLDLRLYFGEGPKGPWLSVEIHDADGRQVGKSLPIDKPDSIGPYFDALAAKAYPVAAGKRTKPLQR
jgi:hypothetical protein